MKLLKEYLEKIPQGMIENTTQLEKLLANCWEELKGDEGGMEGYKLHGRMENVSWNPPELTFTIERHGGTVMGSTKAGLQRWTVNIEKKEATYVISGHRQLYPRQSRLDVNPIADRIADLIMNKKEDKYLKWYKDGHVQVLIGEIISMKFTPKQTVDGRRKRFRSALNGRLQEKGWEEIRPNNYISFSNNLGGSE